MEKFLISDDLTAENAENTEEEKRGA